MAEKLPNYMAKVIAEEDNIISSIRFGTANNPDENTINWVGDDDNDAEVRAAKAEQDVLHRARFGSNPDALVAETRRSLDV